MKKNLIFCAALAAIAFAGCSKDENSLSVDGRTALQITSGIQTRAAGNTWEANDAIGIYMYAAGTQDISEEVENISYKTVLGNGKFTPSAATIYFPVDGSNVDFHAWYPYTNVGDAKWSADLTVQTSQAAIDLMTAQAKSNTAEGGTVYNKNQPTLGLNFGHRLTKLELRITNGNGISIADLNGLKVEITKQWKTVLYEPGFDAIGFVEEVATIPLLTSANGTSAEAILFPDNLTQKGLTAGRQLVFTLSSSEVFYWNIPDTKSFNAGEKNLYTITINRTGLDVTSTITDWTPGNGDNGETGSAE